jgi:protein O-mannosyl-transferase
LRPFGFHLTNLLFHIANAVAVFFLVRRLDESPGLAAAASLLWALHPVQVETVAWISERKNVLSTFFFLLGFLTYLRYSERPDWRRYLLLLLLYVAALLSKVNTIVLPALLLVHTMVWRGRLRGRDIALILPLLACGAVVAWANLHGNPSHGVAYHGGSFAVTLRTTTTTIPRYLFNVLVPIDLSSYYPVPLRASWLDPFVAASVLVITALVGITIWLAVRRQPEAFWLAWFGITLAPMLNFVPFPALMNDRYLYIPLVGALVLLLRQGRRVLDMAGMRRIAPALVGTTALVLAVLTAARVPVFAGEVSLWADFGLRTSYITADEPYGAGPRVEQKRLLNEALAAHPDRAALHNNLGGFAFEENRMADALPYLTRAYELDPHDPVIALNLGRTYLRLGRIDDAVRTLEVATALEPPSFFAHLNLARAYALRKDFARAHDELARAKAIKADPHFWRAFEQALARAEQQR